VLVRARACCALAEVGTGEDPETCANSADLRARETVVRVMLEMGKDIIIASCVDEAAVRLVFLLENYFDDLGQVENRGV